MEKYLISENLKQNWSTLLKLWVVKFAILFRKSPQLNVRKK